jgi:ElaB/YqjD/DUF883 family membrane-anchored ribosome-binding protein
VATEQDAARDRVLAARAELEEDLEGLEASARAAVDIPARIRQSPAKAAAVAAGAGFLVLKGPVRLYRFARKAVTGSPAPMPKRMLPKEIEKTLRSLGDDGDKVRGALERDFADYAKKAEKDRKGLLSVLLLAVARPLVTRGARAAGERLFSPTSEGLGTRLRDVRESAAQRAEAARASAERTGDTARERVERAGDAARDRVARARAAEDRPDAGAEDSEPTGI